MTTPIESRLLEDSIKRVWNEHDDARRLEAMREIYHPDAVIFEPSRAVTGHQAISDVVRDVLKDMPPGFTFRVVAPPSATTASRPHGGKAARPTR